MTTPLVLVKSFATKTAYDIIANILKSNGETAQEEPLTVGATTYKSYACHLKTKYYETTVALVAYEDDLTQLPAELFKSVEGFICYVNCQLSTRKVLQTLSVFAEQLKSNRVELNLLLIDRLAENPALGLTYDDVKRISNVFFDVITMEVEDDPDEDGDSVLTGLQTHVWSTVKGPLKSVDSDDEFDSDAESQILAFEGLLNNMQNFKNVSSTLDREQVLDQAEKLAEMFSAIMHED